MSRYAARRRWAHRGYFAIGIYGNKTPENLGTLWRSASLYEAAFTFTVGARYPASRYFHATDTTKSALHTPMFHFTTVDDLIEHLPHAAPLVGVELDPRAEELSSYHHLERAVYLLGAEDNGLPPAVLNRCHALVQIETIAPWSMNVAVAGSILMHDRMIKRRTPEVALREAL